ncbi:phosphate transport system permease protein PstA [Alteromonas sp. KC3]|uniref:phosphate ABC transporter permease PstA n=1 Tax=unclassified Alteromonas TaxID=2614992 RepID=UPI001922AA21|nr:MULTISPECIES: phosphate ABC transporter permease PstA [unclassified Alteromonas]BCO17930.1 phosphate transport system permease protein PstA [Alteromonas sp. KC3]BCO21891.1 phosphate transport system permease protein PstA [Alteromonas sp. KC14]
MANPSLTGLNPVQRQSLVISLTAFFTSLLLIALVSVLILITYRGTAYFWPEPIYRITMTGEEGQYSVLANVYDDVSDSEVTLKYSNEHFPYGSQMRIERSDMDEMVLAFNSAEIKLNDGRRVLAIPQYIITPENDRAPLSTLDAIADDVALITEQIETINTQHLAPIHEALSEFDIRNVDDDAPAREKLVATFKYYQTEVLGYEARRNEYQLQVTFAGGSSFSLPISRIQDVDFVSRLSTFEKWKVVLSEIGVFLTDSPKQANTSGGVFPALFGTVLMVFLMTIIVTPFGVLAAIYLSEYAPHNALTTVIRVSVSNMAGVPSIVYGVFGLGFFVYTLGGSIDELLFSDKLPAPTMGSPGVFWAALTMAILTLPVVIVATEEGLRRVPEGLKAGSYALGATKMETIVRTILPIASPGIMTGVILAIARAAGEVAPLMLVGAVKFAPSLPIDGEFPYLHLDRQFMHLGVLIYDGAFHSQTDGKSASMMFAACLLLLLVVFVLNILAVILRTRLRRRYLKG